MQHQTHFSKIKSLLYLPSELHKENFLLSSMKERKIYIRQPIHGYSINNPLHYDKVIESPFYEPILTEPCTERTHKITLPKLILSRMPKSMTSTKSSHSTQTSAPKSMRLKHVSKISLDFPYVKSSFSRKIRSVVSM